MKKSKKTKELVNMINATEKLNQLRKVCEYSDYKIKYANFGIGVSKLRGFLNFVMKL